MQWKSTAASAAMVCAAAVGCSGCGEAVSPLGDASVRVTFSLAPGGCEGAGVTSVALRLDGSEIARGPCSDGALRASDVSPSRYDARLVGFDASGSGTHGVDLGAVTLRGDVLTTLEPARLTALPAVASASWRFEDGSVCGALGVEAVTLSVFDDLGWEFASTTHPCDAGEGVIGDVPAGAHVVWASAVGADGVTHDGLAELVLKRGDESSVLVILSPR